MPTILICGSTELNRSGLTYMLNQFLPEADVTICSTLENLLQLCVNSNYDLIILTISVIPKKSSAQIISAIRSNHKDMKIIAFSDYDEHYALQLLRAGINGYLSKSASLEEFNTAVSKVLSGERYINETLQAQLLNVIINGEQVPSYPEKALTKREKEVMSLMLKGNRMSDISDSLGLSYSTVSNFKKKILTKMKAKNVLELAEIVKN